MEGGRSSSRLTWERSGFSPKDVDVAQIYDGFSASVIYGLESYGFCKEGEALDFIQDGRMELDGELPLNTFGGSLGTGRIHGLWHIIEGALQASGRAGERQVKDVNVSFVGASAPDRAGDDVHLRQGALLRGLRARAVVGALAAALLAACGTMRPAPPAPAPAPMPPAVPPSLRLDSVRFGELESWTQSDPRSALQAFLRSCVALAAKADDAPLGGVNYAGTAGEWRQVCNAAALVSTESPEAARGFFESEFVPYRVAARNGRGPVHGLLRAAAERQPHDGTVPIRHRSTVFPAIS